MLSGDARSRVRDVWEKERMEDVCGESRMEAGDRARESAEGRTCWTVARIGFKSDVAILLALLRSA